MPLNETSLQKANAQTGIKSPVTSIPAPSGVTPSSYPAPTVPPNPIGLRGPAVGSPTAQPTPFGSGEGRGQGVNGLGTNPDGSVGNYTAEQWKMMDAIANGQLRKDEKGNWYNPQAATGFDAFMETVLPILSMALAGGGLAGIGSGAAASAASSAADGLSYIATTGLPEYASLGTEMAASTAAAGEVAATGLGAGALGAGTLAEFGVTASSLGAGLTAGEIGAGLGAGIGGAIELTGGTSAGGMPAVNAPPGGGLSQYLPKNMISSGLKNAGMNAIPANILGSAGQGSIMSLITGGDPLKGAISGGFSSGISQGLQAWEASTGALDVLGNSGIAAVNGAVTGASTSFILGGKNPLQSGLMGAAGGFGGSIMSEIMGGSSGNDKIGQFLGAQAGQMAMASILNQGTPSHVMGQNKSPAAAVTPQQTIPSALTTPTVNPITASTVTPPNSPFYGVGYGGGGGGNVASSGDDSSYWGDDQQKLKQLMAALQQQGGVYG